MGISVSQKHLVHHSNVIHHIATIYIHHIRLVCEENRVSGKITRYSPEYVWRQQKQRVTDGQTDGQTDGRTDRRTDRQTDDGQSDP